MAVRVTLVFVDTAVVVIGTARAVDPKGTVTLVGTLTLALPVLRLTLSPLGPAAPSRYTATFMPVPPTRLGDASLNSDRADASTVRLPVFEAPFKVAVSVTTVVTETGLVETGNEIEVAPDEIDSVEGATTLELFEEIAMEEPLGPAFPLRVMVASESAPPKTAAGEVVKLETAIRSYQGTT